MDVPGSRYSPSPHAYNPNPKEWEYPQGSVVVTLNSAGAMYWGGRYYFVSEALSKEKVRVQRVGDVLLVSFRHMYIREINTRSGRTIAVVMPME